MTASSCQFAELKNPFLLQPRHKWFSAESPEAEDWFGPHDSIGEAADECAESIVGSLDPRASFVGVFVTQGRKVTKLERKEWGAEHEYQVVPELAFRVSVKRALIAPLYSCTVSTAALDAQIPKLNAVP